jgi:hypothetical protein
MCHGHGVKASRKHPEAARLACPTPKAFHSHQSNTESAGSAISPNLYPHTRGRRLRSIALFNTQADGRKTGPEKNTTGAGLLLRPLSVRCRIPVKQRSPATPGCRRSPLRIRGDRQLPGT